MWLGTSQIEKKTEDVQQAPLTSQPATPLVIPSYTDYRPDMGVTFGGVAEWRKTTATASRVKLAPRLVTGAPRRMLAGVVKKPDREETEEVQQAPLQVNPLLR